jgi:hypothetical protein
LLGPARRFRCGCKQPRQARRRLCDSVLGRWRPPLRTENLHSGTRSPPRGVALPAEGANSASTRDRRGTVVHAFSHDRRGYFQASLRPLQAPRRHRCREPHSGRKQQLSAAHRLLEAQRRSWAERDGRIRSPAPVHGLRSGRGAPRSPYRRMSRRHAITPTSRSRSWSRPVMPAGESMAAHARSARRPLPHESPREDPRAVELPAERRPFRCCHPHAGQSERESTD